MNPIAKIMNSVINTVKGEPLAPASLPTLPAFQPANVSPPMSRLLAEENSRAALSPGARKMLGLNAKHSPHRHEPHPGFLAPKGRGAAVKLGGVDLLKSPSRRKLLREKQAEWQRIHDELSRFGGDSPKRIFLEEQAQFSKLIDADVSAASSNGGRKPRSREAIEAEVFEIRRGLKAKMREFFASCQPIYREILAEAKSAISRGVESLDAHERATAENFGLEFVPSKLLRMVRELDRTFDQTMAFESVPPAGFAAHFGLTL